MKTTRNIAVSGTQATGEGLRVSSENAGKILSILVDLYRSPVTPVRELVINAIEAVDEAVKDTNKEYPKVLIDVETKENKDSTILGYKNYDKRYDSATFKIIDKGIGMSSDDVRNVLLNITTSTKDTDNNSVGGFGIGAKAVFSIAKTCTWRTTKDGVTTTLILSATDKGTEDFMDVQETGEENGTTVIFPVDGENATRILDRIDNEFLRYADHEKITMTVDGFPRTIGFEGVSDMENGDIRIDSGNYHSWIIDDNITVIGMGGIPYDYTIEDLDNIIKSNLNDKNMGNIASIKGGKITVRMDIEREDINPSRESLKSTERLDKKIINVILKAYNDDIDNFVSGIRNAKDAATWRTEFVDAFNNVNTTLITPKSNAFDDFSLYSMKRTGYVDIIKNIPNTVIPLLKKEKNYSSYHPYAHDNPMAALLGRNWNRSVYISHYMDNFSLFNDENIYAITYEHLADRKVNTYSNVYSVLPKFITNDNNFGNMTMANIMTKLFGVSFRNANEIREEVKSKGAEDRKAKGLNKRGAASAPTKSADPIYLIDGDNKVSEYGYVRDITDSIANGTLDVKNLVFIEIREDDKFEDTNTDELESLAKFVGNHNGVLVVGNKIEQRMNASINRRKEPIDVNTMTGGTIHWHDNSYTIHFDRVWNVLNGYSYDHKYFSDNLSGHARKYHILHAILVEPDMAKYFDTIDSDMENVIEEYFDYIGRDMSVYENISFSAYQVEGFLRWSNHEDEMYNQTLAALFTTILRQNNLYDVSPEDVKVAIEAAKAAGDVLDANNKKDTMKAA